MIKDIKENTKSEYTVAYATNQLRINLSTTDDYRSLTNFYDTNKIKYHTFKNPQDNKLSVIIRNLPPSLTDAEITNELQSLKLPVNKATRLYNREKRPMPIVAVEMEQNSNDAKKISNLLASSVASYKLSPESQVGISHNALIAKGSTTQKITANWTHDA